MIININKPKNWTSFDVVAKLRSKLGVKKIGHAGTLDPLATGVLIVLTEKDTKKQNEIMLLEKEYTAKIAFGATSKTYDLEGELVYSNKALSEDELRKKLDKILPKYLGKIKQKVPPFSAVKVKGKKLYDLARLGKVDEDRLPVKDIEIHKIEIISVDYDEKLNLPCCMLSVVCGSGTYIRSLANDIGKELGVGGVLVDLVRTRIGDYSVEDSKDIYSF